MYLYSVTVRTQGVRYIIHAGCVDRLQVAVVWYGSHGTPPRVVRALEAPAASQLLHGMHGTAALVVSTR